MSTQTSDLIASVKAHKGLRMTALCIMALLAGVEVVNILIFLFVHLHMYWS